MVIAYVKLFTKQTAYHKMIAATSKSVLVLENFDNAKVRIVTSKSKEIKVDLNGPAEDILNILMRVGADFIRSLNLRTGFRR